MDTVDRRSGTAIAASLLVHAVALAWLPGLGRHSALPAPLQILLPQPLLQASAPSAPRPAPPAPARRAPQIEAPAAQRLPLIAPATLPAPAALAAPPAAATATANPPPAAPAAATTPAVAAPAAPDRDLLTAYGHALAGAVATRQRYPRVAQLRQWQGTSLLQLELAADGRLLDVRVLSSSGHEILDRQALEMVRAATPLPPLPAAFGSRSVTVDVPVVFRLAS
ncbi:MAG: energy transducer TonB [Rhodocyclales bacterium]|nr:energy transducer TonB [Rhodocyclales bacterium]